MNKEEAQSRLEQIKVRCEVVELLKGRKIQFDSGSGSNVQLSLKRVNDDYGVELCLLSVIRLASCCGIAEVDLENFSGDFSKDLLISRNKKKEFALLCYLLEAAKCLGVLKSTAILIASINHKQVAWEPAFDFIGFQKIFEGINPGTKNPIKVYMLDLTKVI